MIFKPKNAKEHLALNAAYQLNDLDNLPLYIAYANRYPGDIIRRVLREVLDVPGEKIKKSRGALFNHLVQKYANENYRD